MGRTTEIMIWAGQWTITICQLAITADRQSKWPAFLLLARYVPNVAKRSIWDQCKKKYILRTDRRPATDRPTDFLIWPILGKFQMAISPRRVIRSTSCLVLRWGFRGRRIEWRYFRFRQIQDGDATSVLKNSNGDISAADHPIYSVFASSMGFSGSADFNGANSGLTKFNRYVEENNARGVIRLVTIQSISCS